MNFIALNSPWWVGRWRFGRPSPKACGGIFDESIINWGHIVVVPSMFWILINWSIVSWRRLKSQQMFKLLGKINNDPEKLSQSTSFDDRITSTSSRVKKIKSSRNIFSFTHSNINRRVLNILTEFSRDFHLKKMRRRKKVLLSVYYETLSLRIFLF